MCKGVSERDLRNAWRYLWQSAEAGNVAAMSKFGRDPGLSHEDPAVNAEGWIVYRANAPRLLWQAVVGGDVAALHALWFSTATGLSAGGKDAFPRAPSRLWSMATACCHGEDPERQAGITNSWRDSPWNCQQRKACRPCRRAPPCGASTSAVRNRYTRATMMGTPTQRNAPIDRVQRAAAGLAKIAAASRRRPRENTEHYRVLRGGGVLGIATDAIGR